VERGRGCRGFPGTGNGNTRGGFRGGCSDSTGERNRTTAKWASNGHVKGRPELVEGEIKR